MRRIRAGGGRPVGCLVDVLRHGRPRRCLAPEHFQVHRLQLGPRVNAELVGESPADRLVRGQRLRLPSGRGQRPHQQSGDLLIERVMGDQHLERSDVPARRIVGHLARQPGDRRVKLHPLQPLGVRGGELARVGQRGPPPQPHRLLQAPLGQQPLEPERVHVIRLDRQPVPGRRLLNRLRSTERPPGPGHQRLQRVGQVRGGLVPPDRIAKLGGAHRPPAGQREPRDQVAQPRAGDDDRGAPVVTHLKRTQDRDLHPSIVAEPRGHRCFRRAGRLPGPNIRGPHGQPLMLTGFPYAGHLSTRAHSSAEEHPAYNRTATGSIPVAPTFSNFGSGRDWFECSAELPSSDGK